MPRAPVLADAAYGNDNGFRDGLQQLKLEYAVGVQSSTSVWPPGFAPLPSKARGVMGRPPKLLRRDERHQPLSVKELALCLSPSDLRGVSWREGTRGTLHSRFAALRVRVAHRDYERSQPREEQWLLIEWPTAEKEPTKYWLSNLPASISVRKLAATAKLRWRIERDYEELKQELGLGHFEGRNWRGFHHHASLCIAAYGFLVVERCLFSPAPDSPRLRAAWPPPSPTPPSPWREAPRRCRFEPNGITRIPSPPCAERSQPTWLALYPGVPAACVNSYNTVVLGWEESFFLPESEGPRPLSSHGPSPTLPAVPPRSSCDPPLRWFASVSLLDHLSSVLPIAPSARG